MSPRVSVAMTPAEVRALLEKERTMTCATLGRDGWPHVIALWYVVRDGTCWAWTYAKSQKVRNLERDPRCTLQVETGSAYHELRGAMLKCRAVLHRDPAAVEEFGAALRERYGGAEVTPELVDAMRAQAAKRVGLQFVERRRVSWDHRKLGGAQ